MPIVSLSDVAGASRSFQRPKVSKSAAKSTTEDSKTDANDIPFPVCVIPSLPNSETAKALLLRITKEFLPIIQRRNYNISSISELCCCGDGLDTVPTKNGKKRRQRRKMPQNVLGYNQIMFGRTKVCSIHIRLRKGHTQFFDYEDAAGTLAHELAHCEHSNHGKAFYKLMDEIIEEHTVLMTSGLRQNGAPMVAFGGSGNRLGAATANTTIGGQRLGGTNQGRGYKLGGDSSFTSWMTPAEAAVVAAEARRRQQKIRARGDRCCQPIIIDLTGNGGSDSEEEVCIPVMGRRSDDKEDKKRPAKENSDENVSSSRKKPTTDIIDLTNSPEPTNSSSSWACRTCTFRNRPLALVCEMCCTQRNNRS